MRRSAVIGVSNVTVSVDTKPMVALTIRLVILLCVILATAQLWPARANATESDPARIVGGQFEYVVARGDLLARIGARYGIDYTVIARDNGLTVDAILRPGLYAVSAYETELGY